MSTVERLLSDVRRRGLTLWTENGSLRYRGPKDALTGELLAELRAHRDDVVAFLRAASARSAEPPPLVPRAHGGPLPLSYAQSRLWVLEQIGLRAPAYNEPVTTRVAGPLDLRALERCFAEIVRRHGSLRTRFTAVDGVPHQIVDPPGDFRIAVTDVSVLPPDQRLDEARRLAREEGARPFDLETGPLIRVLLVRLAPDDHVLHVTMHHIVTDGWSSAVMIREFSALYTAFSHDRPSPLAPLPLQYADYAIWQREWLQGEALAERLRYWKERLAGAPALELPLDRPRPAVPSCRGAHVPLAIPAALTARLKELARACGATTFMVLLAAFDAVLARWSGQDDIVVGMPVAGRGDPQTAGLIGFFVNALVARTDLSGDPTLRELIARVKDVALDAYLHQDVPFEKLVEELQPVRDLSRQPLFQVVLSLDNLPEVLELPNLRMHQITVERSTSKLDLALSLRETAAGLEGGFEYATDVFDRARIERMGEHLLRVLEQMAADPECRLSAVELTSDDERAAIARWNDTAVPVPDACVHELVEAHARRQPGAVALVADGERVSYGELDARANRLAHHLRALGVGRGTPVGVCFERSAELVVALLAVLKAGGAYVPLDPAHPAGRIELVLAECGAPLLLCANGAAPALAALAAHGGRVVRTDELGAVLRALPAVASQPLARPDDLAYVMFTSGSSGTPKGAMIEHRGVVNLLVAAGYVRWGADRVFLHGSSIAFDASVFELWGALVHGARCVLSPQRVLSAPLLRRLVRDERVDATLLTPSLFNALADEDVGCFAGLADLLVGGEALSPAHVRRVQRAHPALRLINAYGPTECTMMSTFHRIEPPAGGEDDAAAIPIGRPIANARAYVLDARGEHAPVGIAGELCIAGAGVARGYLHRPELSAERFVQDPFVHEPGACMYRTGDRARRRADGALEYAGRLDDQVKLRGFRIEPGEIEAALQAHPGVRRAVVLAREDRPGDKRLVAYVVGDATEDALRAQLARTLPEYMIPAGFVRLDALPLTGSGKIDRKALPAPRLRARAAYAAPRTPQEAAVAEIWGEILGVERVGIDDDFFELGGHSLLAVRVLHRIAARLGTAVSMAAFFRAPTVAACARLASATEPDGEGDAPPPLVPVARTGPMPLSFAQSGLWFVDQLGIAKHAYNVPTAIALDGPLDSAALERSLVELVRRHESLRTRFVVAGGAPAQAIGDDAELVLEVADLRALSAAQRDAEVRRRTLDEAQRPFDLETGPLVRALLLRRADDAHVLLLTLHHIVVDGWSIGILIDELAQLYPAFVAGRPSPLPPPTVQYADYAAWQRAWLRGDALERRSAYWKARLRDAPALELPADRPRPAVATHRGAYVRFALSAALSAQLRDLARECGVTTFVLLLAAFEALLARWTGQDDLVVATPFAGRGEPRTADVVGLFVNVLVLRADLSGDPTLREVIERVREVAVEAYRHGDLPFEKLVEELQPVRDLARQPLYQVMVAANDLRATTVEPGLRLRPEHVEVATAKCDVTLFAGEGDAGIEGAFEYATDLFDRPRIERMATHLVRVLEQMAADPDRALSSVALLTAAEREALIEGCNGTAAPAPDACLHELFADRVRLRPQAVALMAGDGERVTYAQLDARAERLARHLRALGAAPGTLVATCFDRTPALVAAILAVLKTGAAYVPLDPTYPAGRMELILAEGNAPLLLTDGGTAPALSGYTGRVVDVAALCDDEPSQPVALALGAPAANAAPSDPAYVMYTSGSTGTPKGVVVEHRSVVNLVTAGDFVRWGPERVFLFASSSAFDASVFELWGGLLHGARCVLSAERVLTASLLHRHVREDGVEIAWLTASLFNALADEDVTCFAGLADLIVGGEALSPAHVRRVQRAHPALRLVNGYGPTECTTFSTCHAIERDGDDSRPIPIGRPIANVRAYVLDAGGEPVPAGAGELWIGGAGVARGYLHQPRLTAERFVPDPFVRAPGARMYRTGDRARRRDDGALEYAGRLDDQVKLRGFRIELGEIETALQAHPGVERAVVTVREDRPGDKRLVAYVVGSADEDALRAHLARTLPDYMIPAAFVALGALPLTAGGKVDRKALPAPRFRARAAYVAPRTPQEADLAAIWAEILGVERVGAEDDFFELGGHSLLAVKLLHAVGERLGVRVRLTSFFDAPTVAALARALPAAHAASPERCIVTLRAAARRAPLFLFHPVGGHALGYRALVRHLDRAGPVYGVERPEAGTAETPRFVSVDLLAERYAEEIAAADPGGPYALCGWSLGGLLAVEVAARLASAGKHVAFVGLIDAVLPTVPASARVLFGPDYRALEGRPVAPALADLPPEALQRIRAGWARDAGGAAHDDAPGADDFHFALYAANLWAYGALETVRAFPGVRYYYTRATAAAHGIETTLRALGHGTRAPLSRAFDGDHYTIVADPIAAELAAALEDDLFAGAELAAEAT